MLTSPIIKTMLALVLLIARGYGGPRAHEGDDEHLKPRVVSICQLFKDLRKYNRKTVRITGRLVYSREVLAITDHECPVHFVTSGFTWPNMIALTDTDTMHTGETRPRFDTDKEKMDQMNRAVEIGLASAVKPEIHVTLLGEIRLKGKYLVVNSNYGKLGTGYGHLGAAPALLIIRRVESITQKSLSP